METIIKKDDLLERVDAVNKYVADAFSVYSQISKTNLTGVEGFKYAVKKKEDSTEVNDHDFQLFFNKILVMDYLRKKHIDIRTLSKEEKEELQSHLSSDISDAILCNNGKNIVVKGEGVTDASLDYEFILNVNNSNLFGALSNLYNEADRTNLPYYLMINADFIDSFNDSITLKCSSANLDATLDVLNKFISENYSILLKPIRFSRSLHDVVGFREAAHTNIDVYHEVYDSLMSAIDATLASYGIYPTDDKDRYSKLSVFSTDDAKNKLIENFKTNLMNSSLDMVDYGFYKQKEDTVIKVEQPTVTFENNLTNEQNLVSSPNIESDTPALQEQTATSSFEDDSWFEDLLNNKPTEPEKSDATITSEETRDTQVTLPAENVENENRLEEPRNDQSSISPVSITGEVPETPLFETPKLDKINSLDENLAVPSNIEPKNDSGDIQKSQDDAELFPSPVVSEDVPLFKESSPVTLGNDGLDQEKFNALLEEIHNEESSQPDEPDAEKADIDESLSQEEISSMLAESESEDLERQHNLERAKKYQAVASNLNFLIDTKLMSNGVQMSLLDYLDKIDVLNKIPLDSVVLTGTGKMSGEEFIRECVIRYAVNETDNDLDSIMAAYGAKIEKEKAGIFSKIFK